jgi:3-oxoadipate enol-lactonase
MYYENNLGKVYYEAYGPESGAGLFFFHGVSIDHETFKTQVDAFKDRYRVVVWDMPYHGLSSPIDYKLQFSATAADFAVAIMDALNMEQAVHVGQSLGSFVAQQLAYSYPERTRASVHIGGGPLYPRSHPILKAANPFIPLMLNLYPERLLYQAFAKHKALTEEAKAYLVEKSSKTGKKIIAHLTQEMYRDMVKGIPKQTKEPMLLCYGDHDLPFIKRMSQKWHMRTPHSVLAEVKDAHHIANQDNPGAFNRILLSFLEGIKDL